ncbi:MAG TPA: diaminopimelate epimerase [Candidatus Nanopelagicales bacterium]|jgi:diaminopimelate epimerase|nr:diaminopimelate epimerase [Candidatus Nanopelagicales bacterium]
MTGGVAFRKGHGTGNDFVLLPEGSPDPTPEQVRALTDRHRGLGADGVLRVVRTAEAAEPAVRAMADRADWFLDYRNADGSAAQMCGNGARLFARHLVQAGHEAAGEFAIATRGGVRRAVAGPDGEVEIELGTAELPQLPVMPQVTVGERTWPATAVFVPNPHAVAFVDDLAEAGDLRSAPQVDPAAVYPDGVNVEFVVPVGPGRVAMRVHERGVGETQSCGTGAAAAMVAAAARDGAPTAVTYTVEVPGGTVRVRRDDDGELTLIGPAEFVADGTTTLLA